MRRPRPRPTAAPEPRVTPVDTPTQPPGGLRTRLCGWAVFLLVVFVATWFSGRSP